MKIGIVTFWWSEDNYGQILQSFALQYFLRKKGHEAFVIKYLPSKRKRDFSWWISVPRKILSRIFQFLFHNKEYQLSQHFKKQAEIIQHENLLHPRFFSMFKDKYIVYSLEVYNQYTLFQNPPEADVYVAGSDQIWAGLDPVFFLCFVSKEKKCIAYAPSFGGLENSRINRKQLKHYLNRFSILAMREQNGLDICKSMGRNDALLVPDPTLLLAVKDYSLVSSDVPVEKDYVLLYFLGNDMDFEIAKVYRWAKNRGLDVKYVSAQGRIDEYVKVYPNVDEWLDLIHKAKYVITNSFHGTVFSIIMNKNFMVVPLSGSFARMNCRITDLLSQFMLEDRMYVGDVDLLLSSINYDKINNLLESKRNEISINFDKWLK